MEKYGRTIYDHARKRPGGRLDPDGNLVLRLPSGPGRYRFVFELGGGSFDPSVMFLKVNGVLVGPTARFWRVPGFEHATPKTEHLPSRQMVCPILEVYLDHAWQGSAITEFPSQAELRRGYYLGEFALALPAGAGLALLRSGWWESATAHVMLNAARAHGKKLYLEEHRVAYAMPPHANSIGVFGFGQTLTVPVGGTYRQSSDLGNTLTIEGRGQMGDGSVFGVCQPWSRTGKIIAFKSGARVAYAAGEAAQCYEPEIGLRRFVRHTVFYKPDILLIVDDVELRQPRGAEIHFVFPIVEPTAYAGKIRRNRLGVSAAGQADFLGRQARLRLCIPPGTGQRIARTSCRLARNYTDADSEYERITIRSAPARRHLFITVLLLAPASFRPAGNSIAAAGAGNWSVNWRGRQLELSAPK